MKLKHTIIVTVILLLGLIASRKMVHVEATHPNKPFDTFPIEIGDWKGKPGQFNQEIYDKLGVDDSYLADYSSSDGKTVQLYVGFFQSQKKGDLIHSPKNCMPGGGWNIAEINLEEFSLEKPVRRKVKLIKLMIQNGDRKQMVLYWYHSRGRVISSEYMQKIYLVVDSIFKRRTDGSLVRIITPVINGDENRALSVLKQFTQMIMPVLDEYIPS